jgi:hypothetical protein
MMGGACDTYGGEETCVQGFDGENVQERRHLEDLVIVGRIMLQRIVKKQEGRTWSGFIWPMIGTGGGLL